MSMRVEVKRIGGDLAAAVESALSDSGILERVNEGTRVALKPNFTYPYHKSGVTTSPAVLRETVRALSKITKHISVVETDGGYGAWRVADAFAGHGVYELVKEFGIQAVNLCDEDRELISFKSRGRLRQLPLPKRLLYRTDLFITDRKSTRLNSSHRCISHPVFCLQIKERVAAWAELGGKTIKSYVAALCDPGFVHQMVSVF